MSRDISTKIDIVIPFHVYRQNNGKCKAKGKAIPLQAWTFPEGSRKVRLPDFKTIGT
jgi:hypothetical protein